MGRQIRFFLSYNKEKEFIKYLTSENDVVLIYPWSPTKRLKIYKKLPPKGPYMYSFNIWNRKFLFEPYFSEIMKEYQRPELGHRYTYDDSGKPLIEFSRSHGDMYGRLYWEKYFIHTELDYDVEEFEKWYNHVTKWIKKSCVYRDYTYYDPDYNQDSSDSSP